jgi:hypothetical protein
MPDPITTLGAIGAALATSAFLIFICGWRGRKAGTAAVDFGWVLGIAGGLLLGSCVLGKIPHWPPVEDQDRLLFLVLPAVVVVELLAVFPRVPRWLLWLLRAALVAAVAPILLYGTSYLSDQGEPGTAEWSTLGACLVLGGLAALLAVVWGLLGRLSSKALGVGPAVCLAISTAGAGLAVMISGYMSGGQSGLALAGAISGAAIAALAFRWSPRGSRPLGVAIVLLYSLLVIGRFFGELSSFHAILLFGSPLLAWLPELRLVRRLPRWTRELTRVMLVSLLVAAIVGLEVKHFVESSPASADSEFGESSAPDNPDSEGPDGASP